MPLGPVVVVAHFCGRLAYFTRKPPLDRPVLMSDCGSDMLVGAEKTAFWNAIAVHVIVSA